MLHAAPHAVLVSVQDIRIEELLLTLARSTITMLHAPVDPLTMLWRQATPAQPQKEVVVLLSPPPVRIREPVDSSKE